jgi:hypothetical protein
MPARRSRTRRQRQRKRSRRSRSRSYNQRGGGGPTWAILQYDNRELPESLKQALEINRRYAKKHNYAHFFFTDNYFLPPYWIKVHLLQRLLDAKDPQTDQPLFKGVAFLDTDAVFVDHDQNLDAFAGARRPFIAGPDITYSKNPADAPFNAGVIIVKNTEEVKGLLRDWMAEYKPRDWFLRDSKWSTPTRWAGPSYEQGSFVEKILPKFKDSLIDIVEAPILQSMYDAGAKYETGGGNFKKDGIFVMHFSAQRKEGMLSQFLQAYKAANP